jgi:PAS domain S-box-containing protein
VARPKEDGFARRLKALDGDMGSRIADYPWDQTELGSIAAWPEHLRAIVGLMLRSQVPMLLMWGLRGTMLYNDAYATVIGTRHLDSLGADPRESWPEMATYHDDVIRTCLAGGTLRYRDKELDIQRSEERETAWFDIDYSPVEDDGGKPAGVIVIVTETTERVQVGRSEAEERQRLIELFQSAPSFMAMLNGPDHRFTFLNETGRRLMADRAMIGRPVGDAIPEAANQGFVALLDRIYRSGESYRVQAARFVVQRAPSEPATENFLDMVYQPVRAPTGEVTGIFVQGIDVTEAHAAAEARARAEAELAESRAELQMLTDSLPVLVSFMDAPEPGELRYRFINQPYERWFSRSRSEIEGQRVRDVMGDAAYMVVKPQIEEALAGKAASFERYMPYQGTSPRHVRIQFVPRRASSGEVIGLYSLVEDITQQRNAEAALRENEEQLRLATEAGEIGLWDVDPIADTVFWPPRVKAMFGMSPDAYITMRDFYSGLHPDDRDRVSRAFEAAADPTRRALYDVEYRTVGREDGTVRWVAAKGRGLFDEGGRCPAGRGHRHRHHRAQSRRGKAARSLRKP